MDINKTNAELIAKNRLELWLPLKILYSQLFPKNVRYGDAVTFYYGQFRPFFLDLIRDRKLVIVTRLENISSLNHEFLRESTSYVTVETPDTNSYSRRNEII
jgi:hypothetical protein